LFIHHSHHPAMEELIRIPLLIHLPPFFDAAGHQRIDQQVRMIDIAPTLLDYLDMSAEADHMDGVSLRPLIEGRPLAEQPAFVGAIDFNIVRTSRLKYRRVKRAFREYPEGEALFAIAGDPLETTDVAARFPDELARLRAVHDEIVRHLVERSDTAAPDPDESPELDAEVEERLRNLGYLD
jgi:arylsulfatase A-like enzyme